MEFKEGLGYLIKKSYDDMYNVDVLELFNIIKPILINNELIDTDEDNLFYFEYDRNEGILIPRVWSKPEREPDEKAILTVLDEEIDKYKNSKSCCSNCKSGNTEDCQDAGGFKFFSIFEDPDNIDDNIRI